MGLSMEYVRAGALFSLGDGHAAQGDGELLGTGIEISFDVRFTVGIVKGRRIGWPRAEDGRSILAVGNARPLDRAAQHATTEMLRWLQAGYALDPTAANILLGSCAEYEIGNVSQRVVKLILGTAKLSHRWDRITPATVALEANPKG